MSDELAEYTTAELAENAREELRSKPYIWTVEIHIDPTWVADGFDLDNNRLEAMLMRELSSATGAEVGGYVLKAPDPKQIRAEQGYTEEGYKARIPCDCGYCGECKAFQALLDE